MTVLIANRQSDSSKDERSRWEQHTEHLRAAARSVQCGLDLLEIVEDRRPFLSRLVADLREVTRASLRADVEDIIEPTREVSQQLTDLLNDEGSPQAERWEQWLARCLDLCERIEANTSGGEEPQRRRLMLLEPEGDSVIWNELDGGDEMVMTLEEAPAEAIAEIERGSLLGVFFRSDEAIADHYEDLEDLATACEATNTPLIVQAPGREDSDTLALAFPGVARILPHQLEGDRLWMSVYESLRLEIQYRAFVYLVTGSQMLGEKLVEVLHEQRYGVKSFSSDEGLVKAWRRVPPDVVLLDGARSEGDIIELCRRIKSDPRVAPTPVVVMVERDDLVGRREAFDAHADEVLLYPFPKFELLARLRAQLELERLHAQVRRPVSGVEGERAVGTPPKSQTAASQNAASGAEDGPSRSAAPPSTRSAGEGGDRGAPLQILVADESRPIRELLEHHLEAEGWSVELASQGREAEEKLSERDYDVVVVDLEMRFRSGFEILEAIQERDGDRPRAHLMALTSMPRDETMVRAFELGADDVVSKPLRPEVVAARLRRLQRRGDREEAS